MNVYIRFNDDTGEWMWSIEKEEDREYWLDAFKTCEEAKEYCNKLGLTVNKIEKIN